MLCGAGALARRCLLLPLSENCQRRTGIVSVTFVQEDCDDSLRTAEQVWRGRPRPPLLLLVLIFRRPRQALLPFVCL